MGKQTKRELEEVRNALKELAELTVKPEQLNILINEYKKVKVECEQLRIVVKGLSEDNKLMKEQLEKFGEMSAKLDDLQKQLNDNTKNDNANVEKLFNAFDHSLRMTGMPEANRQSIIKLYKS